MTSAEQPNEVEHWIAEEEIASNQCSFNKRLSQERFNCALYLSNMHLFFSAEPVQWKLLYFQSLHSYYALRYSFVFSMIALFMLVIM